MLYCLLPSPQDRSHAIPLYSSVTDRMHKMNVHVEVLISTKQNQTVPVVQWIWICRRPMILLRPRV